MFTSLHFNTLKIITYLDTEGTYKNNCFLCEKIIQSKTPDFTLGILYERVKLFPIQRKIGNFHKYFYIQQIEKYPTTVVTTKYLENIIFLTLDIKYFILQQATSVLGQIMPKYLALNPTVKYRNNPLTTIVPYPWKVAV